MPTYYTLGHRMIDPDFSFKEIYWRFLSKYFIRFYGEKRINDPYWVQKILINCFHLLSYNFRCLIKEEKRASFYVFVQNYHENSTILWIESIKNNPDLKISNEFPAVRRILKLILEEATLLNLKGHPNFAKEIKSLIDAYDRKLEEILYVGFWYFIFSEYIAKSKLFPESISLGIENKELIIYENHPYNHLFTYISKDIPSHDHSVVVDNNIEKIKETLLNSLGIDYEILSSVISIQLTDPSTRFGLIDLDSVKENICKKHHYDRTIVDDFYSGLTLTKDNTPFIDERVLSNQENHRIIFRPILRYRIDDKYFEMIGYNKWLESLTSLSTNSFPWGMGPEEWLKYLPILKLIRNFHNTHDKLLEEPAKELLKKHQIIYDSNIKSLKQIKGNNIRINKEGIGEIDLIFLHETKKTIFIGECKHNRSRFDYNNWRRDYSNFVNTYEKQLEKKVTWCEKNKSSLNDHFKMIFPELNYEIVNFDLIGIFIINAPTLYMYDGKFKAFTLHEFERLINNTYEDITFRFEDTSTGKKATVRHPFFQNLRNF